MTYLIILFLFIWFGLGFIGWCGCMGDFYSVYVAAEPRVVEWAEVSQGKTPIATYMAGAAAGTYKIVDNKVYALVTDQIRWERWRPLGLAVFILVCGGAGFLGAMLATEFFRFGFRVW